MSGTTSEAVRARLSTLEIAIMLLVAGAVLVAAYARWLPIPVTEA